MFGSRKRIIRPARARRLRHMARRYALVFSIAALVLVAGSSHLLHRDEVTIKNIQVEGNRVVTDRAIRMLAQNTISGAYALLFPKASIFLYPAGRIEATLYDSFTRISAASVSFVDFQTISIQVEEREPFALWCRRHSGECFFLDAGGFIYARAPEFSGNAFFRYYGALNEALDPIGARVAAPAVFRDLASLVSSLKEMELEPVSLTIISDTDVEVERDDGSRIIGRYDTDLAETTENIRTFFESDEYSDRINTETLNYADFRFGNKVYYVFE